MEEFLFDTFKDNKDENYYVLIIYDIVENKRRNYLVKLLKGYGFRVQKSAFEAYVSKPKFEKLLKSIGKFAKAEDTIRVYKIIGKGQTFFFGTNEELQNEKVIII